MQGMWDRVLLLELSGVGAVPFLCISSLLAAPKGVKGVKKRRKIFLGSSSSPVGTCSFLLFENGLDCSKDPF